MSAQNMMVNAVDPKWKGMYRLGGLSAFLLVVGYLILIALFVPVYPPPSDGQAMLEYLDGKTTVWWAIIGVSALTDILYAAIAFSLYLALKGINRDAMLVATGFKWLFVVLELAISWPIYAGLISLSGSYAEAATVAQREAYAATASYATGVLDSTVLAVYTIVFPAIGTLLIGLVMRKGVFSKTTAYLGVVGGILGIVSVVEPLFVDALKPTIIFASLLYTVWYLLVGFRLYRLGQQ